MKTLRVLMAGIVIALAASAGLEAGDPPGREFTATAEMTTAQGTRRMPVTLVVQRFSTVEDADRLAGVLENGGQGALLGVLRGRADGRLRLGALEIPLGLVVAEPLNRGYRYVFVTARAIKIEEANLGGDSLDYPFGVAVFELSGWGKGSGELYPMASISVDPDDGSVSVEQFDADPGRLLEVKQVR
jgi:hypothetical protein